MKPRIQVLRTHRPSPIAKCTERWGYIPLLESWECRSPAPRSSRKGTSDAVVTKVALAFSPPGCFSIYPRNAEMSSELRSATSSMGQSALEWVSEKCKVNNAKNRKINSTSEMKSGVVCSLELRCRLHQPQVMVSALSDRGLVYRVAMCGKWSLARRRSRLVGR
jgi:hypothetical protein